MAVEVHCPTGEKITEIIYWKEIRALNYRAL